MVKTAERVLWRFVDRLIVVSPSIRTWYMTHIGVKKSEVIFNSPVMEDLSEEADEQYLRKHFGIAPDTLIFLYVGALVPGRGIEDLVEIFRRNDIGSSLVFLGYGPLSQWLEETAKDVPNIFIHEAVPHERVVSIVRSADVGLCMIQKVSLSDYYCLPNKLFEYCFAGIPVLASDFPDIASVVAEYELGICSPLERESIYRAIKQMEHEEKLPSVDQRRLYPLSWKAQEEKLITLYNDLFKDC